LMASARMLLLLMLSVTSMLFGSLLLAFRDNIFQAILNSQLTITPGTAAYNAWRETPIPVYTKFYFFDMLNPTELFHNHEKPILEERGPYTFREVEKKVNLEWGDDGTVSYKRVKYWYFQRNMSVGPLTDMVTTINVPVVGSAEFVRGDFFLEWGISDMLSTIQATIFVKRSIGELLFEGYADTVMEIADSFDQEDEFYEDEEEEEEEKVKMDKFGWFYQRNGTSWSDGKLVMHTGKDDISKLGQIVSWNGRNRSDAYSGECGVVRGSSDGLFPPGLAATTDSISIYSTDLCRPLKFTSTGNHAVHGITVEKFELAASNFANSSVCEGNACYHNNVPSGVQNVTNCKAKSPVFVSRPHFHLADPSYLDQFQFGLKPEKGAHDSSFWIEPESSIPVKVEMRLQLNIMLEKVEGIQYLFKNLQSVMFPVMWFDAVAILPENMAGSLNMLAMMPNVMLGCGLFSLILGMFLLFYFWKQSTLNEKQKLCRGEEKLRTECDYKIVNTRE